MSLTDDTIYVAFSVKDLTGNYCMYAGAAIKSLLLHNSNKKIVIYILNDGKITDQNIKYFHEMTKGINAEINFINVKIDNKIRNMKMIVEGFLSAGALYRLLIADYLPKYINRILYLDCDVIVDGDITALFSMQLDKSVAAVKDSGIIKNYRIMKKNMALFNPDRYFNSGVIVMNLHKIRQEHNLLLECNDYLNKFPKDPFSDQSALNYVFKNDCKFISEKYNKFPSRESRPGDAIIWHFSGANKPWKTRFSSIDKIWWHNLRLSPWGSDVNKLFDLYSKIVDPLDYALLHYPSGSKRSFFKNVFKRTIYEIKLIGNNYFF